MPLHKYPVKLWKTLKLRQGIYSRLPEHYLKSLQNEGTPTAVHYKPHGVKYKINPKNGQRELVQDVAIPLYFPPESQKGLWGGEGWIIGYRYANNDKLSRRVKKTWKPHLYERELYSEILDKKFTAMVTMRTLDLIDEAYGFDFYILKTPKEDLCSKFGMDLKRGMLLRLARRDPQLHPDDPEKREAIYDKYKEFVIPEEEAEWVGLTLDEAVEKQRLLEEKVSWHHLETAAQGANSYAETSQIFCLVSTVTISTMRHPAVVKWWGSRKKKDMGLRLCCQLTPSLWFSSGCCCFWFSHTVTKKRDSLPGVAESALDGGPGPSWRTAGEPGKRMHHE